MDYELWNEVLDVVDTEFWEDEGGFDITAEVKKWIDLPELSLPHTSSKREDHQSQVCDYEHYRTSLGSPTINRRSFTEEEIDKFTRENDGFPLPCSEEEIKDFDELAFNSTSCHKRSKKKDRQRSKSATSIPDLATIRQKLQRLQSPGKPKFLEHLINRVVSRKFPDKRDSNGIITDPDLGDDPENPEELENLPEELLSPDTEKCLVQAETLVEELLTTAKRPASGESTDSGKGSLLESTSDFSPTPKRQSWSTPTSPSFQGIVKQRLKGFQALQETSDTESVTSPTGSIPTSPKQKSFRDVDLAQEVAEVNKSIKQFYCAISEDETFNSAVMEGGYVKALVSKINSNKIGETDKKCTDGANEAEDQVKNEGAFGLNLASVSNDGDSGWDDWSKDYGDEDLEDENGTFRNSGTKQLTNGNRSVRKSRSNESASTSSDSTTPTPTPRTSRLPSVNNDTPIPTPRTSTSRSSTSSSTNSSRTNSVSDNDNQAEEEEAEELPKDRLHKIAYELLTTERAYVARLHLLDTVFHFRVLAENQKSSFLSADVIQQMFSNIKPIYLFHQQFLLPQLETRMKNWLQEQKMGDIMAKLAPFLKLYTGYVRNYDNSMSLIDKWTSQSPKFAAVLQEIQSLPECGHLTLQHHMLEPIQRVPRYEMLLKDYIKHLGPEAADREDAQKALDLVTEAARHSNTAMKKIDKFHKLLSIIQRLNGEGTNDLVSPTRELVKEGIITKISARSGEKQARYLFLFNDLVLVCSEQIMGSYRLRARLSVDGMEILPGENITIQNTFCVKCTEKTIEFLDDTNNGAGLDWLATFEQMISDYKKKELSRVKSDIGEDDGIPLADHVDMGSQLGKKSPFWVKDDEVTMCMQCQNKFSAIKRRHHCRACGKVFCARCSPRKVQLEYDNNAINRVCQKCYDILKKGVDDNISPDEDHGPPMSPKPGPDVKQIEANKAAILSSYLNVMDKDRKWSKRWITVHNDFVMYFYKKNKDVAAIQTLPLPGHSVKGLGDSQDRPNVFSLTHKDVSVCYFQADSEQQFNQWVRILSKMVQLQLPSDDEKRLSTVSTGSSHSTSSGQSSQS